MRNKPSNRLPIRNNVQAIPDVQVAIQTVRELQDGLLHGKVFSLSPDILAGWAMRLNNVIACLTVLEQTQMNQPRKEKVS